MSYFCGNKLLLYEVQLPFGSLSKQTKKIKCVYDFFFNECLHLCLICVELVEIRNKNILLLNIYSDSNHHRRYVKKTDTNIG